MQELQRNYVLFSEQFEAQIDQAGIVGVEDDTNFGLQKFIPFISKPPPASRIEEYDLTALHKHYKVLHLLKQIEPSLPAIIRSATDQCQFTQKF